MYVFVVEQVDDTDTTMAPSASNSFTVYTSNRCLVVSASTPDERDKWVSDLRRAIDVIAEQDTGLSAGSSCRVLYPSLKSNSMFKNEIFCIIFIENQTPFYIQHFVFILVYCRLEY